MRKSHARFLGEGREVTLEPYPTTSHRLYQLLSYRDEFIFTSCDIRSYFDPIELLDVDRDINAALNIKRVGLGLFPTIKRRKGKGPVVVKSVTASTSKEVLAVLRIPEA